MHIFLLTVRGVFTKHRFARWAIVQLAGRRILVPLIVVQVHVAQPTRTQTSPSSSRPRTAAFHAVNSGSNPLGDAKENQALTRNREGFFRCGANLPHHLPHRFEKFVFSSTGRHQRSSNAGCRYILPIELFKTALIR